MAKIDELLDDMTADDSTPPQDEDRAGEAALVEVDLDEADDTNVPEPDAAIEAESGGDEEETPDSPPDEGRKDHIPLPVYLEEKKERKRLEEQIQQLLKESQKPKQEKQEKQGPPQFNPTVSYEDDAAEYLHQKTEYQQQYIDYLTQHVGQIDQDRQKHAQQQYVAQQREQLNQHISAMEHEFKAKHEDYDEALSFLADKRRQELETSYVALGYQKSPELMAQIKNTLANEFWNYAYTAVANNANPADAFYRLATQSGFAGKSSKGDRIAKGMAAAGGPRNPGGAPKKASQPAEEDEVDIIAQMQREAGYRKR